MSFYYYPVVIDHSESLAGIASSFFFHLTSDYFDKFDLTSRLECHFSISSELRTNVILCRHFQIDLFYLNQTLKVFFQGAKED